MKNNILKVVKFLLFLSIGVLLLYLAFKGIPLDTFMIGLKNAKYSWVILSIVLGIAGYLIRSYRWIMLIEPLGYRPSLKNTFFALALGYLANFAFPRLGEITRCGALSKTDKIPVDKLIGTVIIERVIDVISLVILMFLVFFMKINFFGAFITEKIFNPALAWFYNLLDNSLLTWLLAAAILFTIIAIPWLLKEKMQSLKVYNKAKSLLSGITVGLKSVVHMKRKKEFIIYSFLLWLAYALMSYVVFFAIPATSELTFVDSIFILIFGGIGMTIPVQGGFGTYHAIVALGLSLYGIPKQDGLIYATLSHEAQAVMVIIIGFISFLMISLIRKKTDKAGL